MANRFDLVPTHPARFAWVTRNAAVVLAVPLTAVVLVWPLLLMYLALLIYIVRAVKWLSCCPIIFCLPAQLPIG